MAEGVVKWFNDAKWSGFIGKEIGGNISVRHSVIQAVCNSLWPSQLNQSRYMVPNTLFFLILLTTINSVTPVMVLAEGDLDGRKFETVFDGKRDVLTFQDGTFQSSFWTQSGFGEGEYTTETSKDVISFRATTINQENKDIEWKGVIDGDSIIGSYLWTRKGWFLFGDSSKKIYFRGTMQ